MNTIASLPGINDDLKTIIKKVEENIRISPDEGLHLFNHGSLALLGSIANSLREQRHGNTTYFNRNFHIEPTNICVFSCKFCSYSRLYSKRDEGWELSIDEMVEKVKSYDGNPITEVHIVGGVHPKMDIYFFEELLKKINRETHLEVLQPRMLSGHFQGRVLSMFSKMIKPNRILEIGTYTGYSALCLAEGLTAEGKLVTIDLNEELENRVRGYFNSSDFSSKITYLVGDAIQLIPTISEKWDIVFIDADKLNYLNYYHLVFSSVKVGGYIIADNVLWSGKVADSTKQDRETNVLREYNDFVHNDRRVEEVLMPIRDGLMIARKISE